MTRWKAAGIHLGISACVAACAAAVIFGVWYPEPYSAAVGAAGLVVLLLGVDVVLGPLLTLVVFKSGKPSLRFDLAVIALLQVCAFVYGMSVVVRARPAFVVARIDRFVIVNANELEEADLARARDPAFRTIPWTGPKLVGAQLPEDPTERNALLFSGTSGKDLEKFPQYYVDYGKVSADLLKRARDLPALEAKHPEAAKSTKEWLSRRHLRAEDVAWIPLDARKSSMTMLLSRSDGRPLDALLIDPW